MGKRRATHSANHSDHPAGPDGGIDAVVAAATGASERGRTVAALNPEAGDHAVTTDPRELGAALRAGELTWQRFPYYAQRYGERGRRFTRSDSAWIVTAAQEHSDVAERQLRWLGALLAARGMPRWLLELHLEALHGELGAARPEKRTDYDNLVRVAATLKEERLSRLDDPTSAELAATFDRQLGRGRGAELPEAGWLLVAAVADEAAGVARAVDSLLEWLADPARFPAEWVAAARDTVTSARELATR